MTTRYVNTASTAGGNGTTNGIAGASRAFATLGEAVRSLPSTLTDAVTIYCDGSGGADTDPPTQADFDMTTTAANYLLITATGSARHAGVWTDTNPVYRVKVTNRSALYNNIPSHIRFDGLQVQVTVTDGGSYVGIKTSNANQLAVDIDCRCWNCLVKAVRTSGAVIGFNSRWPDASASGSTVFENCLAIDCTTGFNNDFQIAIGGGPGQFYNCTAANCVYGFVEDADMLVMNCLSYAGAVGIIGFVGAFYAASDYNAESDGNGAPGAHSRSAQTFTFVNAAGGNYALAEGDVGARDRGGFTGGYLSTDILGVSRSDGLPDIGAFEYSLGGGLPSDEVTPAHSNLFLLYGW